MGRDVPEDGRIYPEFSYTDSVKPVPELGTDITQTVTHEHFGPAYKFVVGIDFGQMTSAAIVLRAYKAPGEGKSERLWYAVDEFTSRDKTTEWLIAEILRRYAPTDFIAIGDPHVKDGKEVDRSDYTMTRHAGINIVRASSKTISVKHRYNMVNALLNDASGKRRLFVARTANGRPACDKLSESFGHLKFAASGRVDNKRKGPEDMTHWSDAIGYALFPFEKLRGADSMSPVSANDRFMSERWFDNKGRK